MAAQTKEGINLLPQEGLTSTTTGRILAWILSTFRIIVIVTEIIVMVAFLSRFWLDARSTDLTEEINQKRAVLAASSNFEKEFKSTQNKLEIFSALASESGETSEVTGNTISLLPADVTLTGMSIADNSASIDGRSPNEISIQQFIINLSENEVLQNISLAEATSDPSDPTVIEFRLTGEIQ